MQRSRGKEIDIIFEAKLVILIILHSYHQGSVSHMKVSMNHNAERGLIIVVLTVLSPIYRRVTGRIGIQEELRATM